MPLPDRLEPIDVRLISWMACHGITITRPALTTVRGGQLSAAPPARPPETR